MSLREVGVLFELDNKNVVTLIDARSRNKFNRLLKDWAGIETFDDPEPGQSFEFLHITFILATIEENYKKLSQTPATEKIARQAFRMIDQIKVQNDIPVEIPLTLPNDEDEEQDLEE